MTTLDSYLDLKINNLYLIGDDINEVLKLIKINYIDPVNNIYIFRNVKNKQNIVFQEYQLKDTTIIDVTNTTNIKIFSNKYGKDIAINVGKFLDVPEHDLREIYKSKGGKKKSKKYKNATNKKFKSKTIKKKTR